MPASRSPHAQIRRLFPSSRDWEHVTRDELAALVEGQSETGIPSLPPIELPLELTEGYYKTTAERLAYRFLRPYRGAVIGGYKVVGHDTRPTRWSLESTKDVAAESP